MTIVWVCVYILYKRERERVDSVYPSADIEGLNIFLWRGKTGKVVLSAAFPHTPSLESFQPKLREKTWRNCLLRQYDWLSLYDAMMFIAPQQHLPQDRRMCILPATFFQFVSFCSVQMWSDFKKGMLTFCFFPLCRCNGGVFWVWCGGVPCFPDVAHHRGKDTRIFCEGQNRGAALSTSPVGHAASSQAWMQRQTAPGGTRAHTSLYTTCHVFFFSFY